MADADDPDYADLFRPDPAPGLIDPPAAPAAPAGESGPEWDSVDAVDPDAGRLFRSQGVMAHPQAVLAIPIGSRLKTLSRTGGDPDDLLPGDPYEDDAEDIPESAPRRASASSASSDASGSPRERVVPVVSTIDSSRTPGPPRMPDPVGSDSAARVSSIGGEETDNVFGQRPIPGFAVWIIIGVLTLAAAFLNAILAGGRLGWPTGLVLFASTIYCSLIVRRSDLLLVIIAPPLVFLAAALTAGQLGVTGGGLVNRVADTFFALGDSWLWIVGSVVAAIALTVIRRSVLRR